MKWINKPNLTWVVAIVASFFLIDTLIYVGIIDPYYEVTLVLIGINIILACGLNLIVGFSGQFSLGHAGFMAIGAYTSGIMTIKNPTFMGFIEGMILGMILASIVALLVGIPTLRLKGDYLAIATLGISEIIRIAIVNMDSVTNGASGISGIPLFTSWQLIFLMVIITTIFTANYVKSSAGRATISVREDEIAAEAMGVNTTKYKVLAFVIGAITASIGGALYASYIGSINPGTFDFMKSVDILIIVVFGGMGSITGTFIAAFVLGFINMFLQDFGSLRMIIYALALIIIMVFKPSGLLGRWEFSMASLFKRKNKGQKGDRNNATIGSETID